MSQYQHNPSVVSSSVTPSHALLSESSFAFELPESLNASAPPERRGLRRDHVRLMTLDRKTGEAAHGRFFDLERFLRPGDLLVVNTSRTMPAVLYGTRLRADSVDSADGQANSRAASSTRADVADPVGGRDAIEVRLAGRQEDGSWRALVLGSGVNTGDNLAFSDRLTALVVSAPSNEGTPEAPDTPPHAPPDAASDVPLYASPDDASGVILYAPPVAPPDAPPVAPPEAPLAAPPHAPPDISPLATLRFSCDGTELEQRIYEIGQPVRYEYTSEPWDLDYYQTVFATVAGSLEMPSAGRPFSWELLFRLQRRGVGIADLQLHTGLSYWPGQKRQQHPSENGESYRIPAATIEAVERTRSAGGRVIAVGTTVVRALESAFMDPPPAELSRDSQSIVSGWTYLFINRHHKLQAVDGLITGFHEPEASHLALLSAFIDPMKLRVAYQEAICSGYLWHEFGDVNLIL